MLICILYQFVLLLLLLEIYTVPKAIYIINMNYFVDNIICGLLEFLSKLTTHSVFKRCVIGV